MGNWTSSVVKPLGERIILKRIVNLHPWVHILALVLILVEILEIQLFIQGPLHHLSDAIVVIGLAITMSVICYQNRIGVLILLAGAIGWTLDVLDAQWAVFDLEGIAWTAMHCVVGYSLAQRLFNVKLVRTQELTDSVSLYLVVGVIFANVYGLLLWRDAHAIVQAGAFDLSPIQYPKVIYYSFVTQATVGYGDIAPASGLARFLSLIQSMFGVFYLAILIARFVSLHTVATMNALFEQSPAKTNSMTEL